MRQVVHKAIFVTLQVVSTSLLSKVALLRLTELDSNVIACN